MLAESDYLVLAAPEFFGERIAIAVRRKEGVATEAAMDLGEHELLAGIELHSLAVDLPAADDEQALDNRCCGNERRLQIAIDLRTFDAELWVAGYDHIHSPW